MIPTDGLEHPALTDRWHSIGVFQLRLGVEVRKMAQRAQWMDLKIQGTECNINQRKHGSFCPELPTQDWRGSYDDILSLQVSNNCGGICWRQWQW